mgnify:CR=1 FL=1
MLRLIAYTQSEAARKRHPNQPDWVTWHVIYGLQDARNEGLYAVRQALNLPWLAIVDITDLPKLWQRARYYGRIHRPAADPAYTLHCLESEARDWLV